LKKDDCKTHRKRKKEGLQQSPLDLAQTATVEVRLSHNEERKIRAKKKKSRASEEGGQGGGYGISESAIRIDCHS